MTSATEQPSFFGKGSPALTSDRTDWETPRDLFDRLDAFWHFDLDVAASDANHLCPAYFTKETDGLSHSWKGHRVWCNPPYGKQIADWVRKAYEETRDGRTLVIMLVPARTDTRWYHDYIQGKAAEVKFLRGRLKYTLGGGGAELRAVPFDACEMGWRAMTSATDEVSCELTTDEVDYIDQTIADLRAENAKLRELVEDMWRGCPVDERDCIACDFERDGMCDLFDRMRELGVEVEQ